VLYALFRAIAECFARLSHRLGVCLSVRPSVRHTRELYENGANYHEIFTVGCPKDSSVTKFCAPV